MIITELIAKTVVGKIMTAAIVVVLLIGACISLHPSLGWGWLTGKPLEIDQTANVVEHIRKISEFTTACYYEEYVIQRKKPASDNAMLKRIMTTPEIVLMAKGRVRAGFDLSKISADDMSFSGDTLRVVLPAPEIFDVITNPSDYEIFVEQGGWTHEEITELQIGGRERVLANAIDDNILQKADSIGRERLTHLFQTFGFGVVELTSDDCAEQ
ncbi:MAG: DUF4230 domain-containing protein [Alistipes sp.]|nr:DUF4230 domain-containing protein [Alistipes sp.]